MVPCSTIHFSPPLFFQPVRSFPLNRETHSLGGRAFATTTAATNIAAARNAPILLTGKPPSLLVEESEGLVGRNLSQIQPRPGQFPSVALGFNERKVCNQVGHWFRQIPGLGCTAWSGRRNRTDKSASTAGPFHPLRIPRTPGLPRHPSKRSPPGFLSALAPGTAPKPAHNSRS